MKALFLAIAVATASIASAAEIETRSTMCQAVDVVLDDFATDRRIIGCGPGFPDNLLWHLDRSDSLNGVLDGTMRRSTTGRGAVVYVLDTGIRADHEELMRSDGSIVLAGLDAGGWDAYESGDCASPVLAPCPHSPLAQAALTHGTSVASVVAGIRTGIAPDARLVAVRVTSDEARWVHALRLVIEHAFAPDTPPFRTAIINISGGVEVGNDREAPEFEALMRRMITGIDRNGNPDPNGKRFLFVVAAGNSAEPRSPTSDRGQCASDDGVKMYPAVRGTLIDGLVAVGGLTRDNTVWPGSCKGAALEVLAPAEEILTAEIAAPDLYRWMPAFFLSGTSYATPYVSGMAARLLESDPSLTPAQLESRLKESPSRADGLPVPVMVVATPKLRASRSR